MAFREGLQKSGVASGLALRCVGWRLNLPLSVCESCLFFFPARVLCWRGTRWAVTSSFAMHLPQTGGKVGDRTSSADRGPWHVCVSHLR